MQLNGIFATWVGKESSVIARFGHVSPSLSLSALRIFFLLVVCEMWNYSVIFFCGKINIRVKQIKPSFVIEICINISYYIIKFIFFFPYFQSTSIALLFRYVFFNSKHFMNLRNLWNILFKLVLLNYQSVKPALMGIVSLKSHVISHT